MLLAEILPADIYITLILAGVVGLVLWFFIRLYDYDSPSSFFYKKWPPISEDEFIGRCHTGVDRSVALRVRRMVSEQLGIPYEQIYPEQKFLNDLDCC